MTLRPIPVQTVQGHPGTTVARRWVMEPRVVGQARHDLRGYLLAWGHAGLADAAELVLSELVTNALRHADVPQDRLVETRYARLPDGVRIEVHDADPSLPVRADPAEDEESGRGLELIDIVTGGRWGACARDGVGKRIWAEVTVSESV